MFTGEEEEAGPDSSVEEEASSNSRGIGREVDKLQFLEVLVIKFSNFTTDFALSLVYYDSILIIKNMLFLHCSVIYIIFVELMFYSGGAWGQTDADIFWLGSSW